MAVADSTKVRWTETVASFEAATVAVRLSNGAGLDSLLQAQAPWQDTSSAWFGDGWDSWEHLRARVREARSAALIAQRPARGPESVAGAYAGGFAEGAADGARDLGNGIAAATKKALELSPLLVLAVGLALFLRLRG